MHLGSLTDEELIALVRVNENATEMERELAARLALLIDEIEYLEQKLTEKDE